MNTQALKYLLICCLWSLLLSACKPDAPMPTLKLKAQYPLAITEPSGLSPGPEAQQLWVVSDQSKKVYLINTQGQLLDSLFYLGNDPEGIAQDPTDGSLWVLEETRREVIHLHTNGRLLSSFKLDIPALEPNKGPEGISISSLPALFVVNEANPAVLYRLNLEGQITEQFPLDFAQDYSGLFWEAEAQHLWILSDQSATLSQCTPEGKVLQSFQLNIPKAEGLAMDKARSEIYIVSESDAQLYVFQWP
ncbi:MAG: hypothetical protein D6730_14100 [Bacteroidetes bacterium]|nr:MAG: hypothetical protein D6730_14100 [Bacteroidota bacterium]